MRSRKEKGKSKEKWTRKGERQSERKNYWNEESYITEEK